MRRVVRDFLVTVGSISFAVVSCGGETDDKKASSTGGKSGTGGSGGSSTGGSGGSTTGGSGGSTTGGSAGTATGGSAGSASGGSAGSGSATVSCGSFSVPNTECQPNEYCCNSQCQANGTPCTGWAFHCDEASDCPSAYCCVTKLNMLDGGSQVAECKATCDADSQLIVCKGPSQSPGGCPSGMSCNITATLPAEYGFCCPGDEPCGAI